MRDRLRNKFFRFIGVTPHDDFLGAMDDIMKVLSAFDKFTVATNKFCNIAAERMGIVFDGEKIVEDNSKSEKDIENEYRTRGMI